MIDTRIVKMDAFAAKHNLTYIAKDAHNGPALFIYFEANGHKFYMDWYPNPVGSQKIIASKLTDRLLTGHVDFADEMFKWLEQCLEK